MGGNEGSDARNRLENIVGMWSKCIGGLASIAPEADTLAAHDAVTNNSRKAQQKVGKLVSEGRHAAHTALLE